MTMLTGDARRIASPTEGRAGVERRAASRGRGATGHVVIGGEAALLERLREPLRRALSGRPSFYEVSVHWVGRCGEVLVSISGARGRLPLLFDRQELEPGYVSRVVRDAVEKYAL